MRAKVNKTSKRNVLYEGSFLRFVKKGEWEFFERNNCSAIVIIVAVTKNDDVLFVEQYRSPVSKKVIEFPAGLVNDNGSKRKETIYRAAIRELLEETGYKAEKLSNILVGPVSSGSSSDMVTMLLAKNVVKVNKGGGDQFESIIVHKVAINSVDRWLDKMRKRGYLIEPKIYTGLYFLKTYNRKFLEE